MIAAAILRNLIAAGPCKISCVLTDKGIRFTNRQCDKYAFTHIFDRVCIEAGIEHRLAKIKHLWTNGQVERMNRTTKDAAVKRSYYRTHEQLKSHMHSFLMPYNFARRLKTLKGLAPYEYICNIEPERFNVDPFHHTVGLNN